MTIDLMKTITVLYSSLLQDLSHCAEEQIQTNAEYIIDFLVQLKNKYGFQFGCGTFKVIVNDEFKSLYSPLNDGDKIIFHPPMAGG